MLWLNSRNKKIVYISVPKCGSRTFVWIAWILKDKNNISAITDTPYLLADKSVEEMVSPILITLMLQWNEKLKNLFFYSDALWVFIS